MNSSPAGIIRRSSIVVPGLRQSAPGRVLLALCAVGSLAMAPAASAKAPNGVYRFTGASGKIVIAGRPVTLTKAQLKKLGAVSGNSVTIRKGDLVFDREAAVAVTGGLSQAGLEFDPAITAIKGPTSITFAKSGSSFTARNRKPVVADFTSVSTPELVGVLRTRYDAKVTDGKLVIQVTFSGTMGLTGSIDQPKIDGTARITCTR